MAIEFEPTDWEASAAQPGWAEAQDRRPRILGVLAGDDLSLSALADWIDSADITIAADGAAHRCLAAGRKPDLVVGDFDSLDVAEAERQNLRLRHIPDQETTDCDKLLVACAEYGSAVTLVGMEGDRLDHTLSALFSAAKSSSTVSLGLRRSWGRVIHSGEPWTLQAEVGRTISLLPLVETRGVQFTGVEWPLNSPPAGATLAPLGAISISNRVVGSGESAEVGVNFSEGCAVLFLETDGRPRWE